MKMFYSMYDDDYYTASTPKTLGDWVKNFRVKKLQMKRRLRAGGNLRVCAIMTTALLSAENQLRLKQQERLNRCLQLQSKFHEKLCRSNQNLNNNNIYSTTVEDEEKEIKRRIEISNLWREELNGLDNLLRKTSSSSSGGINNNSDISCMNNGSCAEAANQCGESVETTRAFKSIAVLS